MIAQELIDTAKAMVANDKGLLAMDESNPTCNKRFAKLGIPQTVEARRAYRELIVTTPGLGECISGAILFDETIRRAPSTRIESVNLEESFVSFQEKENDLFTRTCNESSLDSMRRHTSCQAKSVSEKCARLVAADVRRRVFGGNLRIAPPPYVGGYIFQTRSKSLRKLVSSESNKNPSATTEFPFPIGVAPRLFPTLGATASTGKSMRHHL
jgi:hypothetical protein